MHGRFAHAVLRRAVLLAAAALGAAAMAALASMLWPLQVQLGSGGRIADMA